MTDKEEKPICAKKRSSLKMSIPLNPEELAQLQKRTKRLSVNWDTALNFKSGELNKIKTSFQNEDHQAKSDNDFKEARRKSIKGEFSLVKEMFKNKQIEEETAEEEDEEIAKNTQKNIEVGKIQETTSEKSDSDSENEG